MNQATGWMLLGVVAVVVGWALWPRTAPHEPTVKPTASTDPGVSAESVVTYGAGVRLRNVAPDKLASELTSIEKRSFCEAETRLWGGAGRIVSCRNDEGTTRMWTVQPASQCMEADLSQCSLSVGDLLSCYEAWATGICSRRESHEPCRAIPKVCRW